MSGIALAGCSQPSTLDPRPTTPAKGYIRLAGLTAEYPLQREVRRLRDMEATLRGLPGPPPPVSAASARLPALPDSGASGDLTAAQERRNRERAALRAAAERQLAEYAAGRQALAARLREQRRAELMGQFAAQDTAAARARQAEIEARTLERLEAEVADKLENYSRLAVLDGQLNRPMDYVAPRPEGNAPVAPTPDEAERLLNNPLRGIRRQARLEAVRPAPPSGSPAATPTPYPTMPERLETKRQVELAELRRLDAEIRRIKREGRGEISDAEREARRKRLQKIDDELDAYRDNRELALTLREQRLALEAVLGAENAAARDSLRAARGGNADKGFDLALLGGANPATPTFSVERAIARLVAQRRELESLIRVAVADSARDFARNRNADIVLIDSGDGPGTGRADTTGRQDMTQDFRNWLAADSAAGFPAPAANRGGRL